MKIGEMKNGIPVTISQKAPNKHVLLIGTSGSGKSTRIGEMLEDCLARQETVVVIDINGCDYTDGQKWDQWNIISAINDGIKLSLLDFGNINNQGDDNANFIGYIVDIFSAIGRLGARQMGVLREAVEYAVEHRREHENDLEAIAEGLHLQDSPIADGVFNKLWNLLNCPAFRHQRKEMLEKKVNVLSLKGINPSTQKEVTELILASLWKNYRINDRRVKGGLRIVIDEFQNLISGKNSILPEMLREARKYGINLLLCTQYTGCLPKDIIAAISQTAVQLYFRPASTDVKKIAEFIDQQHKNHWVMVLKKLSIGESVAVGDFWVNGKAVSQPIIIRSSYDNQARRKFGIIKSTREYDRVNRE